MWSHGSPRANAATSLRSPHVNHDRRRALLPAPPIDTAPVDAVSIPSLACLSPMPPADPVRTRGATATPLRQVSSGPAPCADGSSGPLPPAPPKTLPPLEPSRAASVQQSVLVRNNPTATARSWSVSLRPATTAVGPVVLLNPHHARAVASVL